MKEPYFGNLFSKPEMNLCMLRKTFLVADLASCAIVAIRFGSQISIFFHSLNLNEAESIQDTFP